MLSERGQNKAFCANMVCYFTETFLKSSKRTTHNARNVATLFLKKRAVLAIGEMVPHA